MDRAVALLDWANAAGADTGCVRIGCSRFGGMGLFATRALPRGATAFRCPCTLALSGAHALADGTVGDALGSMAHALDDEQLVMLLLLHCKRQGATSPWAAYVNTLPNEAEASALLPAFWPEAEQRGLLEGTPLLRQARESVAALHDFHDIVQHQLVAQWPDAFPADSFSFERLCWAYAMWQSRAIRLEMPGGARRCLVPLLDMMNHSSGLPSTVTLERRGSTGGDTTWKGNAGGGATCDDPSAASVSATTCSANSGAASIEGGMFAVACGRAVGEGEEIYLDYGAKGNAELLRCHGFVLDPNLADVEPSEFGRADADEVALRHRALGERTARGPRAQVRLHFFLFTGGLPPLLVPTLRVLCAAPGAELAAALAVADGGDDGCGGGGEGAQQFDWGLVDWSADDPFAAACDAVRTESPAGDECERRTLRTLVALLQRQLARLPTLEAPSPSIDGIAAEWDSAHRRAAAVAERQRLAQVYVSGQRAILHETIATVESLIRKVAAPNPGGELGRSKRHGGDEDEGSTREGRDCGGPLRKQPKNAA